MPPPAFDGRFSVADQRLVGERHRRMTLARDGERFDAVAFNHPEPLPARLRALYRPEVSEWNGLLGLELVIEHWEALD
jgi:single-stranded-DNA-specific exonuclease